MLPSGLWREFSSAHPDPQSHISFEVERSEAASDQLLKDNSINLVQGLEMKHTVRAVNPRKAAQPGGGTGNVQERLRRPTD